MIFCRHVWKVVEKAVYPSPLESILKDVEVVGNARFPERAYVKFIVVHYVCTKCATERVEKL